MNKNGPIIIIEDDEDDQDIIATILEKLKYSNEIVFFDDGNLALEFLNKTDINPFLILSDVNMPRINGIALRKKIYADEKLSIKCIPYLFFTTSSTKKFVYEAYSTPVQGFFIKPDGIDELEQTLKLIIEYWKACIAPGQYD